MSPDRRRAHGLPDPRVAGTPRSPPPADRPGRRRTLAGALLAGWLPTLPALLALPALLTDPVPARAAAADVLHGRVIAVQDGDSFDMLTDQGQRVRIRIAAIDAPESRQRFADRSRSHLRELLQAHALVASVAKHDRYGRLVADVGNGERDVGLAQIEAGWAWHFRRYAAEQTPARRRAFAEAELQARRRRLGLWRDDAPTAPWTWRADTRRHAACARTGRSADCGPGR